MDASRWQGAKKGKHNEGVANLNFRLECQLKVLDVKECALVVNMIQIIHK